MNEERCYNVDGLLYWLSGDSCSQHGPPPPALVAGTRQLLLVVPRSLGKSVGGAVPSQLPPCSAEHPVNMLQVVRHPPASSVLCSHRWLLLAFWSQRPPGTPTDRDSVCQCQQSRVVGTKSGATTSVISPALQFTYY